MKKMKMNYLSVSDMARGLHRCEFVSSTQRGREYLSRRRYEITSFVKIIDAEGEKHKIKFFNTPKEYL